MAFVVQTAARQALLVSGLAFSLRVVLLRDTYAPDAAHSLWSQAEQHEVVGPGYTPGGIAVEPSVLTYGAAALLKLPINLQWFGAQFSARYAAVIRQGSAETISGSLLIGYVDLNPGGAEVTVSTGTLEVAFADLTLLVIT